MYDWLSCKILVTITWYHNLLSDVLYITWVPIGKRLLVACAWFLLAGLIISDWSLVTGCLVAACFTCILAASDIVKSGLACLAHSNSLVDGKSWPRGVLYTTLRKSTGHHLTVWPCMTSFWQVEHNFLQDHLTGDNEVTLWCGGYLCHPLTA